MPILWQKKVNIISNVEDMVVYKRLEQLMFRTYDPITKYPNAEKLVEVIRKGKKKNIFKVKRGVIENARKERALSA